MNITGNKMHAREGDPARARAARGRPLPALGADAHAGRAVAAGALRGGRARLRAGREHRRGHQHQGQGEAGGHRLGRRRLHRHDRHHRLRRARAQQRARQRPDAWRSTSSAAASATTTRSASPSRGSTTRRRCWARPRTTCPPSYDLYKEERRGGSVRIGRPLPWPDYSRGSIGYSLEDVKISAARLDAVRGRTASVLSGIATGQPVRTSSVAAGLQPQLARTTPSTRRAARG